ncbi:MAG: NAD(P)-dependent alcohol dehydrogenase [Spirochaetaceae bacterium]|nr:NAD(P)-dependent alcohol dehydrogenase [Spirochaetaceae bacterium]
MKAIVWTKYGPPEGLQLQEVEKPVPQNDEILIKIHAASVTAGDCEIRRLELPLSLSFPIRLYAGFRKPNRLRILGQELSGEVVQAGKDVTLFHVGDQVFGTTGFSFGAYGEYICLPEKPDETQGTLTFMPENLSYEEAAAVSTAGMEALHYIHKACLKKDQKVLIIGAGGSIGTLAVQIARLYGADITAVDSGEKLEMLKNLGADHTVDYTEKDYISQKNTYDLIIDVVGGHSVYGRLKMLKRKGYYFLAYANFSHIMLGIWTGVILKKKVRIESSGQSREEIEMLKKLIEEGKLKPVIDKIFPLREAAEAHRYAESGHKIGNVILKVDR